MNDLWEYIGRALILLAMFGPLAYCSTAISKHESQAKIACIESGGQPFGFGCIRGELE